MALSVILRRLRQIITLAKQVAPLVKVLAKRAWMTSIAWVKKNVDEAIYWGNEILTRIYNGLFKGKVRKKLPKKEKEGVDQSAKDKAEREAAEERMKTHEEMVAARSKAVSEPAIMESTMSEAATAMSKPAIVEAEISVAEISEEAAGSPEDAAESEDYWRNYWCDLSDPFTTGI